MELEQNESTDRLKSSKSCGRSQAVIFLLRAAGFLPIIAVTVIVFIYRDRLDELQTVGYFGVFVANVVGSGTFIFPVPGIATVIFGATVWNPFLVGLAGGTGATLGEIAGYLAGAGSYGVIHRLVGNNKWYGRIRGWIETRGTVTIFVFAVIPNPFFDVAGFAAGSLGYPISRFVLACWLGKMVKYLLVAYAAFWGGDVIYGWFD